MATLAISQNWKTKSMHPTIHALTISLGQKWLRTEVGIEIFGSQ
jgi:hypothetical protein